MDITALRALTLDVAVGVFGVAATVTPPGADAIVTTGIWTQPITEELPVGRDFQRREPRRVLGFRVADVGTLPRGTSILAADYGGAVRTWRVDGIERQDAEQIRVIVVAVP